MICNALCCLAGAIVLTLGSPAAADTILVTSTAASGPGTLTQAIITANTNPGPNTIAFQIPGTPPFSIAPTVALPAITAPVLIDATTQPGYAGQPVVQLTGTNTSGQTVGLRFSFGASTLRGLAINGYPVQAIELDSPSNTIQGCYIGTDVTGTQALGNGAYGIFVRSAGNLIGGTNAGNGNVISGRNVMGVYILTAGNNLVQGNLIGVAAGGTNALGNQQYGILINGSAGNLIGGPFAQCRNIISGNDLSLTNGSGIYVESGATSNTIQGNFIGTDISGKLAIANSASPGITINASSGNLISSNLISGNGYSGLDIDGPGASGNLVFGNFIGTDVTGNSKLGNGYHGLEINNATFNQIGGPGAGNVISGNTQTGVIVDQGSASNSIQGNLVGVNAAGTAGLGNNAYGVHLVAPATANLVGGTNAAMRNVISANGNCGVLLDGAGVTGNFVEGNYVGSDLTGGVGLGNYGPGVSIQSANSNQIGGSAAGAGNLISGNGAQGILLTGAAFNIMQGNYIGVKADGVTAMGNIAHGIDLMSGANSNIIGGTALGAGNRIGWAPSNYSGVRGRPGSLNNLISGNALFNNGPAGGLGITLGNYSGTALPNTDCENGVPSGSANNGQNFPVITNVVTSAQGTVLRGYLDSAVNKTYHLEFFANPSVDPSGYGQGQLFLGSGSVTLGGACTGGFAAYLPTNFPVSWVVSATATDPANDTSEFSPDAAATSPPALHITAAGRGGNLVSYTNGSGPFTLQQTFSLVPPVVWVAATNPPALTNGTYYVSNLVGQTNVLYRLVAP